MTATHDRIERLARSGRYKTMTRIAAEVGLSRETVRRVLNARDANVYTHNFMLRWPCPDCGTEIAVKPKALPVHAPAHCRECAKDYCKSERHRFSVVGRKHNTWCAVCHDEWRNAVVETRTCEACHKPLEITRQMMYLIKNPNQSDVGRYHRSCYQTLVLPEQSRKTHCKRGHLLAPPNLYVHSGKRYCRECRLAAQRRARQ